MNTISFMSASFVARQLGYNMTGGWGQGDRATNEFFSPIDTYEQRFGDLLREVREMGFDYMDLWTGHLNWAWASEEHVTIATRLLDQYGLRVTSLAGGFGSNVGEFESACKLAVRVGAKVLGGMTSVIFDDRETAVSLLKNYDVKLAIENHPEKTPQEVLDKIGDGGDGTIGTAVDTGWYGTQGYDAAKAIRELGDKVFIVHLKDVRETGGHETCRYGEGVVPLEGCVRALQEMDYEGDYSVEHEPESFDPTADCVASLNILQSWLS